MERANDPISHYYNTVRTDYGINSLRRKKILHLVRSEASSKDGRILDVGCAGGYVSKEIKNKDNFVAGVDISLSSTEEAKKVLDQAYCMDVERDPWPQGFEEMPFDIILCSEVIEHLFDQKTFLLKLKPILKSGGVIIFTTPNFLVWNNRIRMLMGQYGPKEVFFDTGHIHLLSYNGFKRLLNDADLHTAEEDNLWYPNRLEKYKKMLSKNLFVYQCIIKARK